LEHDDRTVALRMTAESLDAAGGARSDGSTCCRLRVHRNVLETALGEEMTVHLGHEKNRAEHGRGSTNVRNGSRSKTVISDAAGDVVMEVPRDRAGTFEPQIVKKRQRRLSDVDEVVLSLYAKGLTTPRFMGHRSRRRRSPGSPTR
jgi:transposase-like protein